MMSSGHGWLKDPSRLMGWRAGAVVCAIGFVLLLLLVPRYRTAIATVDGTHRWTTHEAPLRRQVVWKPAEAVAPLDRVLKTFPYGGRLHFTTGGNVLYFSVHTTDRGFELVRAQLRDGVWSEPQPVADLNSTHDDLGPCISDSGEVMYFYSNRNGGFGGMDLYVAMRDGDGWTPPKNLGPLINSAAHEQEPAISPDGLRLFFASDRSEAAHRSMPYPRAVPLSGDEQGQLDVYQTRRDSLSEDWLSPTATTAINSATHDDSGPSLSPDGAFLMFASDRPTERNEPPNLDLYRVRLDRGDMPPENLGNTVNTSGHERAPTLTAAGFQLHFVRSEPLNGSQYFLLQTTALEVVFDRQWDRSHLNEFAAALVGAARFISDRFWPLLLSLALVMFLIWLVARWVTRQSAAREAALPGFLVVALLLHAMLMTGSFFVFFQQSITQKIKQLFIEEPVIATQVLIDPPESDSVQQPAFDQVAELRLPVPIQPADVEKQALPPLEPQPIENAKPQPLAVHRPISAEALQRDDLMVGTVPIPGGAAAVASKGPGDEVAMQERILSHKQALRIAAVEPIPIEPTQPVHQPPVDLPSRLAVDVEPQPRPQIPAPPATKVEISVTEVTAPLGVRQQEPPLESPLAEPTPTTIVLERHLSDRDKVLQPSVITAAIEAITAVESPAVVVPAIPTAELTRENAGSALPVAPPQTIDLITHNELPLPLPLVADSQSPDRALLRPSEPGPNSESTVLERRRPSVDRASETAAVPLETIVDTVAPDGIVSPEALSKIEVPRRVDPPARVPLETLPVYSDISDKRLSRAEPRTADLARIATPVEQVAPAVASESQWLSRRTPTSAYADAKVRLQSLLMRRNLQETTKAEVIKEFGGSDQTLVAIKRGLSWLEQHQANDGHWSLHQFRDQCQDHKPCDGHGRSKSNTAGTGLALLPFLGDGNTHQNGPHREAVAKGITWLIKNQKPDGDLFTGGDANSQMYSHGIATIALCECYGMTADIGLRNAAQQAVDFIVSAQDPKSGGWRYKPREAADTSVVGWQVMALKSAQMAGLNVPDQSLQEAQRWLQSVAGRNDKLGQFAYQGGRYNAAMTAEALLCLEYLDSERDSEQLVQAAEFLRQNLPQVNRETSYYWYYATQAMFHLQGEHWQQWNAAIHPLLIESQKTDSASVGTWDAKDQWELSGGRVYATSIRLLMLEVYYRHLPIYQVIR